MPFAFVPVSSSHIQYEKNILICVLHLTSTAGLAPTHSAVALAVLLGALAVLLGAASVLS